MVIGKQSKTGRQGLQVVVTSKPLCVFIIVLAYLFATSSASALSISGESTATLQTEGSYEGWYRYDMTITWDLEPGTSGLSHWDITMKMGCAATDHLFEFDFPAGYSNSEQEPENPYAVEYEPELLRGGDPTIPTTDPLIKYQHTDQSGADPGIDGTGQFWFYSNVIPENGFYEDVLLAKAGGEPIVYGDLTGDWPSCTIIGDPGPTVPEPGTVAMLLAGLGMLGGTYLTRRKLSR